MHTVETHGGVSIVDITDDIEFGLLLSDFVEGSKKWGFALGFVVLENGDNSGKTTRTDFRD